MTRNVLRALKVFLAHDLVISFPGIHLTDTVSDSDLCIKMFTAMVFTIQKKRKQPKYPTNKGMYRWSTWWYTWLLTNIKIPQMDILARECCSSLKRNKPLEQAATWVSGGLCWCERGLGHRATSIRFHGSDSVGKTRLVAGAARAARGWLPRNAQTFQGDGTVTRGVVPWPHAFVKTHRTARRTCEL